MNKFLLCILLITSGCVTAEPDRPYSPELFLVMEENIDWLHGQTFNFIPQKTETLVSSPVQKYYFNGRLNKDNIALDVGLQLSYVETQSLVRTLSNEYNKNMAIIDQNIELKIVGSYTISNKHWWDRLDSYKMRMLIVENKKRFVVPYFLLSASDRADLYDTDSGRIN